jgi:hypothetical protein
LWRLYEARPQQDKFLGMPEVPGVQRDTFGKQNQELVALQSSAMDPQLVHAVQSIARSVESHLYSDVMQGLLILLTGLTTWYLWKYTRETEKLRIATRDQVNVNNQVLGETVRLRKATEDQVIASRSLLDEEQKQREQLLMPIVVLTTGERDSVETLVVRNLGNGPALNTHTLSFSLNAERTFDVIHQSVVASGELQEANIRLGSAISSLFVWEFIEILKSYSNAQICTKVVYDASNGKRYMTRHTIMLTEDKSDLVIRFDGFQLDGFPEA